MRFAMKKSIVLVLGYTFLLIGCTVDEPPPTAPPDTPDTGDAVQEQGERAWLDAAGMYHQVRELTRDEIVAQGLESYVAPEATWQGSSSTPTVTAPDPEAEPEAEPVVSAAPDPEAEPVVSAVARPASAVARPANTCWTHWYGWGVFSGVFKLYGRTDVTWCGNGTRIGYVSSQCYGVDGGYPTYEYLGCSRHTDFGVNWNVYDVKTQWHLCYAWVPVWGSCLSDSNPWEKYRYGAGGAVWRLGGT